MRPKDLAEAEFRPLGFNSRTINALWLRDICTLEELTNLVERDLSLISGIGSKAKSQLQIFLRGDGPVQEIHDRPRTVSVSFDPRALTAIDAWALDHPGIKSRAEAVRRLVEQALAAQPNGHKK
jgi:hypothetical protein